MMISSPSISDEYNLSHVHSYVIEGMFSHDGHNLSKGLPYLRAARNRAHIRARFHVGYQTHYLIIDKTYQRATKASAKGNAKKIQTVAFLSRVAPFFASLPQSDFATGKNVPHFALVCGRHANLASVVASLVACIFAVHVLCTLFIQFARQVTYYIELSGILSPM